MTIKLYLVHLLLFSLIFLLQNHLTVQIRQPSIEKLALLAKYWNVKESDAFKLLAIEKNLTIANNRLIPLLNSYNESFGGLYIDVKANLVYINTIDFSKVPSITSSSKIQPFINLLNFKHADYSMNQLVSSFKN